MESRNQVLTSRFDAPATNKKEKTTLSRGLVTNWQNGRREAKPDPSEDDACAMSVRSGNFHENWLMQDQKLADATPKTTSAPALWKNPASSIKAAALKRRSLTRLWTTACSRRSELRFHRSHIRRLDSTHRSLQYLTPYCEVTCHSEPLNGTATPLC